jgi:outer membrane protein OmpA-like peptidoglycan-associated protein
MRGMSLSICARCLLVGISLVATAPHAESGKLNLNADLGLEAYGVKLLASADYQVFAPLAVELALGIGAQFIPQIINEVNGGGYAQTAVPTFYVGVGPRLRFLDDTSGYSNENGKSDGDLWASLHIGLHGYAGLRFGIDAAAGYQWSVYRPLSIGPFIRAALLFDNGPRGADFLLTVGAAASIELIPLKTSPDTDGDGLSDELELSKYLTDPKVKDTDGDGINDGLEVQTKTDPLSVDTDGDGLRDGEEDRNHNGRVDRGETDPRKADGPEVPVAAKKPAADDGLDLTEPETPTAAKGPNDEDSDGVPDAKDKCLHTAPNLTVDTKGCVVIGKEFVLEGVTFASGKSTILPQSERVLEQALSTLKENPSITVEVGGHTDSQGGAASNATLSKARAESVKAWLIGHGLPAKRITGTKGYGPSKPRATNATLEGRAKNRRIEFKRSDL